MRATRVGGALWKSTMTRSELLDGLLDSMRTK
jgi:hypothetical protein